MGRPSSSDWLDQGRADDLQHEIPAMEPPPGPAAPPPRAPEPLAAPERKGILGWAKSIALGARDTWDDMLNEGRREARRDYEERWQEFERKTKYRRKGRPPRA